MTLATRARLAANRLLAHMNLRLDTLTSVKTEANRVRELRERKYFEKPVFPLLRGMAEFSPERMIAAYQEFGGDLRRMMQGGVSPGLYNPVNGFYQSPDADILYLMVRSLKPKMIVEVGSGNSTRVIRQAISDGALHGARARGV